MDPTNKDETGQLIDFEVIESNSQSTPPPPPNNNSTVGGSSTNATSSDNIIAGETSPTVLGLRDYNDYVNQLYEEQVRLYLSGLVF